MNQLVICQARYRLNTWMGRTRTDGPDEFESSKFDCIDKEGLKGVLNIVSGIKYQFFVCLAICNVCYTLYGFLYIA